MTILLAHNSQKKTLFTFEERFEQVKKTLDINNLNDLVKIDTYDGLLVNYCEEHNYNVIIRGIRPLVDFEYEFEMAMTNRELNNQIETVFIITDQKYFYLRSTLIKDIVALNGDVKGKVPEHILNALKRKLKK